MSLYFQNSKLKRQVRHEIEIYISMRMIGMAGNGRFAPLDKIFGGASQNGFEARKVRNWEMEHISLARSPLSVILSEVAVPNANENAVEEPALSTAEGTPCLRVVR
jgi:hypothetical protein